MNALAPPRIRPASHRAKTKPGRSRFGLIALLTALVLAAWVGFGPRAAPPRPATVALSYSGYVGSTAVPAVASASAAPRTKRIGDVRVGDRVKADNPTGDEDLSLGAEVDPATWRKLILRASKRDGSWADVELLRPLSWIEERGARVGGTAPISVPECGIDGNTDVLAIEPCPPIAAGRGRVVTGTFHHSSSRVLDLEIEGVASPIVTTINHLFWSADREQFVRADALRQGEHVRGSNGLAGVISATPRVQTIPVYNLEIHVDHVYHVSAAGVLVHNGTPCDIALARKLGIEGEKAAGISGTKRAIDSITGTARRRFPDDITKAAIIEVKNVKRIGFTNQLRDYLYQALADGKRLVLKVRMSTEIDAELLRLEAAGFIEIIRLPALP